MGSATSTLTPEQATTVKHKLRERFSFLVQKEENDLTEEMKLKIAVEYSKIIQEVSTNEKTSYSAKHRGTLSRANSGAVRNTKSPDERSSRQQQNASHVKAPAPIRSEGSSKLNSNSRSSKETHKQPAAPAPVIPTFKRGVSYQRGITAAPEFFLKDKGNSNVTADSEVTVLLSNHSSMASPRSVTSENTNPIIAVADHHQDCWETTEQPYCPTCKMVFKSDGLLQRHIKYSTVHSEHLKEAQQQHCSSLLVSNSEPVLATVRSTSSDHVHTLNQQFSSPSLLLSRQATASRLLSSPSIAEGETEEADEDKGLQQKEKTYKLLYSGSKFFWRTKETIDLHIYLHFASSDEEEVLEMIGYDLNTREELSRLYLSYPKYVNMLETHPNHHHTFVQLKNEVLDEVEYDRKKRKLLMSALLERVQVSSQHELSLSKLAGDQHCAQLVLSLACIQQKKNIRPVCIQTRQDRTTSDAIATTLEQLHTDSQALLSATSRLGHLVVQGLRSRAVDQQWLASVSPIRRRWILAIHRVIYRLAVQKTRNHLANHNYH